MQSRESSGTGLPALISADLNAMCEGSPINAPRILARLVLHARWRVLVIWRVANAGMGTPFAKPFALWLADRILSTSGAELQPGATIGPGLVLKHTTGLVVGREVIAGARLTLHQNVTLGDKKPFGGQPVLGDDVTIGAGACVLGPIEVGDRVTIAANAVVTEGVPSDCVVAGIPARIVRRHGVPASVHAVGSTE